MAHLAAILFFSGLLIALGFILELIVKANWAEISAALRAVPPAPSPRPDPRQLAASPSRPRAAF